MLKKTIALFLALVAVVTLASAQKTDKPATPAKPAPATTTTPSGPSTTATETEADSVLVTIILKHQQDKNLTEIRRVLEAQGFWDVFPPKDARVVSWNIAMGLGHVIVLQVPAGGVRQLNLAIQNGAWGAYDSEIYLSYDYKPVWKEYVEKREEAKADRDDDKD